MYQTPNGWIYQVWLQGRVVFVGCRATLEAATRAAAGLHDPHERAISITKENFVEIS